MRFRFCSGRASVWRMGAAVTGIGNHHHRLVPREDATDRCELRNVSMEMEMEQSDQARRLLHPLEEDNSRRIKLRRRKECKEKVRKLINSYLLSQKIGGMAVAISVNGKTYLKEGFGYQDIENSVPFEVDTKCDVASLSKLFTAHCYQMAKLRQSREGVQNDRKKLEDNGPDYRCYLSDKVIQSMPHVFSKIIVPFPYKEYAICSIDPEFRRREPQDRQGFVNDFELAYFVIQDQKQTRTPLHWLLCHRSGLRSNVPFEEFYHREKPYPSLSDALQGGAYMRAPEGLSVDELIRNPQVIHSREEVGAILKVYRFPPGFFCYGNIGVNLLGAALEYTTKKSFSVLMSEELRRMGLNDTEVMADQEEVQNMSSGFESDRTPLTRNVERCDHSHKLASEGIRTNVGDLLKFGNIYLAMHQNYGHGPLTGTTVEEMWSTKTLIMDRYRSNNDPAPVDYIPGFEGYGIGWNIQSFIIDRKSEDKKWKISCGHKGTAIGYTSALRCVYTAGSNVPVRITPPNLPSDRWLTFDNKHVPNFNLAKQQTGRPQLRQLLINPQLGALTSFQRDRARNLIDTQRRLSDVTQELSAIESEIAKLTDKINAQPLAIARVRENHPAAEQFLQSKESELAEFVRQRALLETKRHNKQEEKISTETLVGQLTASPQTFAFHNNMSFCDSLPQLDPGPPPAPNYPQPGPSGISQPPCPCPPPAPIPFQPPPRQNLQAPFIRQRSNQLPNNPQQRQRYPRYPNQHPDRHRNRSSDYRHHNARSHDRSHPYNQPPNQSPSPYSQRPNQGPHPYNQPPNQGPNPYHQGPRPYSQRPNQGPNPYHQGPRPYSQGPNQGPNPYDRHSDPHNQPPHNQTRRRNDPRRFGGLTSAKEQKDDGDTMEVDDVCDGDDDETTTKMSSDMSGNGFIRDGIAIAVVCNQEHVNLDGFVDKIETLVRSYLLT